MNNFLGRKNKRQYFLY